LILVCIHAVKLNPERLNITDYLKIISANFIKSVTLSYSCIVY
jgi:hypothetical protein